MSKPSSGGAGIDLSALQNKLDVIDGKLQPNKSEQGKEVTREFVSSILNVGAKNLELDVEAARYNACIDSFFTDSIGVNSTNQYHIKEAGGKYASLPQTANIVDDFVYVDNTTFDKWPTVSSQATTKHAGMTITSSGVSNATNVDDDNTSTYASSTNVNGWIKWDNSTAVALNGVSFYISNLAYFPRGLLKIEGSLNDSDWTLVKQVDLTDVNTTFISELRSYYYNRQRSNWWMLPFAAQANVPSFRYWRLSWSQLGTSGQIRLYSVEYNAYDSHSYKHSLVSSPISDYSNVLEFKFGNSNPPNDEPYAYQRHFETPLDWSGKNKIKIMVKAAGTLYSYTLRVLDLAGNQIISGSAKLRPSAADQWEELEIDISGTADVNKSNISIIYITIATSSASDGSSLDVAMMYVEADTTYENITLESNAITPLAGQSIDGCSLVVHADAMGSMILNTDLIAHVTLDNGSNWEQVSLEEKGDIPNQGQQYYANLDSAATPGNILKWRLQAANNKGFKVYGVGMFFDQVSLGGAAEGAVVKAVDTTVSGTAWVKLIDVPSGEGKLFFIQIAGSGVASLVNLRVWIDDSTNYIQYNSIYVNYGVVSGEIFPFAGHVYKKSLRIDVQTTNASYQCRVRAAYSS